MKTNFLKLILPFAVFMLAIVFAFASKNNYSEEEIFLTGYTYDDVKKECIAVTQDCVIFGNLPCLHSDGKEVFQYSNSSGTMCSVALYRWPNN